MIDLPKKWPALNGILRPLALLAVVAILSGCDNPADRPPAGGGSASSTAVKVDLRPVEQAFASAEPAVKTLVDQGLSAIRSADFKGALKSLERAVQSPQLTPEQKRSLQSLLDQVKASAGRLADQLSKQAAEAGKAAGQAARQVGAEAGKALESLQKK